jgi:hypothetical protein
VAVSVTIDPRFNGPPGSAHGGYTCGLLGVQFEAPVAVSLRVPPPLSRPLAIDGERLLDGDAVVATAVPADVMVQPRPTPAPEPPAPDDPVYGELHEHPFPTCFACGPDRAPGDGLRIFASRIAGGDGIVAAPWTPDPGLAGRDGEVKPIFVAASTTRRARRWRSPRRSGSSCATRARWARGSRRRGIGEGQPRLGRATGSAARDGAWRVSVRMAR